MKVDLIFSPKDLRAEKTFGGGLVIDILRATSVMVTLVARGTPEVLLAKDIDQARELKTLMGQGWYTSGARFGKKVDGFDFANAMIDFDKLDLSKQRFILSTTNGTGTIYRTWPNVKNMLVGALINASATARAIWQTMQKTKEDFLVVISGVRGEYSLDDALTAGVILEKLIEQQPSCQLTDEARTCLLLARGAKDIGEELRNSRTGRFLAEAGLISEVDFTLQVDKYDLAIKVFEKTANPGVLAIKQFDE